MIIPERKQILIVDDEVNLRRVIAAQLQRDGYDVHTAQDGDEGCRILGDHHIDLVITDLRMPKLDGMELLRHAQQLDPELPVVMLTAHGTVDNAVEALKTGAFDYITKPFDQDEIRNVVRKALRTRELTQFEATPSDTEGQGESGDFGIIGQSPAIVELRALLSRIADTPGTVLISGESGTGKELVARALHRYSSRRTKPFIKVACAAIPKEQMEVELLGYERGAFPGAVRAKPGRFELAVGGTLYLDEVNAIPLDAQVALLHALQGQQFERMGGVRTIPLDVRLVAASSVDLKEAVENGSLREDLFYQLNVVSIRLPALRERSEDTLLIADHFVRKFSERFRKNVTSISKEAAAALRAHAWPGNIRQLENVMERAVLLCNGEEIERGDLPHEPVLGAPSEASAAELQAAGEGLKEQIKAAMSQLERELIQRALGQTHNNVTHAARLLKISRKGLQLKMKELGLRERDERVES
ncbi:MAG TPA: sigma-54 dependent transcriptional regulator [Polyangiaceae bacterium]|nr:sigma-54 dependent transcriptional regulator [Polyangiaceae bacterium]